MAINSIETETAAAPVAEVPVVEKTDSSPAEPTSEPAPAEASKPVSCQLSATPQRASPRSPRPAPRAHQPAANGRADTALSHPVRTARAHSLQTSVRWAALR